MKNFFVILCFVFGVNLFGYSPILPQIRDIFDINQSFDNYEVDSKLSFLKYRDDFYKNYFNVWDENFSFVTTFSYGSKYTGERKYYGENKREISKEFKDYLINNENKTSFPSISKKAVTVRNADCRHLPTNKPFFAQDGYPFDRIQNSMIHINTPLKVLHYSLDKEYVFVQAPYVDGWVHSSDIAFVDEQDVQKIKQMKLSGIVKDNVSLYDQNNKFVSKAYIGSIFWTDESEQNYVFKSNENSKAILVKISLEDGALTSLPLEASKTNISKIAQQLYGQNYGWGGYLQNRDCSMLMRDFYAVFGVYLPRNSYDQISNITAEMISIADLSKENKIQVIKSLAVPFATLLYMRGHIMMYIGSIDDKIIIFHSSWGIRLANKEKFIIGGSFITSLESGIELDEYDTSNGTLLDKISAIRIIGDNY